MYPWMNTSCHHWKEQLHGAWGRRTNRGRSNGSSPWCCTVWREIRGASIPHKRQMMTAGKQLCCCNKTKKPELLWTYWQGIGCITYLTTDGCFARDPLSENHFIKDPFWSLTSLFKCNAKLAYTHCSITVKTNTINLLMTCNVVQTLRYVSSGKQARHLRQR